MPPTILDQALSLRRVVELFAEKGITISERTLKKQARETGSYRLIGREMFFLPDDLESLTAPKPPAFKHAPVARMNADWLFPPVRASGRTETKPGVPARTGAGSRKRSSPVLKAGNPLAKTKKGRTGGDGIEVKPDAAILPVIDDRSEKP